MPSSDDTMQEKTEEQERTPADRFEALSAEIIDNFRSDRKRFLETIEKMEKLASDTPEVSLLMCEHTVRAYDVLNKMNSNMVGLASVVLKKMKPAAGGDEDVYGEIGDIPGVQ